MTYLFGAVAFVLALLLSVVLHEAGHLLTAKRFGMKASQFFVGFGPTLWSRRKGETEYGVKGIPLGGFVKIIGYTPLEEVDPADEPRAFYRQPARKRAVVIVAGVVINIVLAFVLLIVLAMAVGVPDGNKATTTVRTVSPCVPASATAACTRADPESPAKAAGLRPGDRIVAFGGVRTGDWDALAGAIKSARPGEAVPVVVARGGERRTLRVVAGRSDGHGYLGVEPTQKLITLGPVRAAGFAARVTGAMTTAIGGIVADIPRAIPTLFSPRRGSSPGGQAGSVVGGAEVSGQVFSSSDPWRTKLSMFLTLVSSLNLFVGLLNLVPLLPLDGGHLAVVCYERLKALAFRLRGRPDPGTVDVAKLLPVTYAVVVLLVGLGALLLLADLVNPLKLPQ